MPKVLDTFEFPHGGRKGMDFDFDSVLDGQIYQLVKGADWDDSVTAESFLGSLSRYANGKNLRVNKHIDEEGNVVTIRARPKKQKEETSDNGQTSETPKRTRATAK